MMKTLVKVAVPVERPDTPCWPHINHRPEEELGRILQVLRAENPEMDFEVACYTDRQQAEADYPRDRERYDGVLVLMMTCWKDVDKFYIDQASDGLPVVVADVLFCGSGSMLRRTSPYVREKGLPIPLVASSDYRDIARAVSAFHVLRRMQEARILVIANTVKTALQEATTATWGCAFVNRTAADLMAYFERVTPEQAQPIAEKWQTGAAKIYEPTAADILESARLYLAIKSMRDDLGASAVTIDCLTLSYDGAYDKGRHMYPCLSHFEMANQGEIGICEADINATISAMLTLYATGRPGFVSDPVVDTATGQITYSHCVSCTKVFGAQDPRTCAYYIRSHAEDQKGAAVQAILPANESLTTFIVEGTEKWAAMHSSSAVGNAESDCGCRTKLVASCAAENLLINWMPQWHRVTVYGDYRRLLTQLLRMKGFRVVDEDTRLF